MFVYPQQSLFKAPVQVDQICSLIGVTVEKLQTMKRKASAYTLIAYPTNHLLFRIFTFQVEEAINDELEAAQNCKRRVEHLKVGGVGSLPVSETSITYSLWKKTRVERFLVDHLLRSGHYSTGMPYSVMMLRLVHVSWNTGLVQRKGWSSETRNWRSLQIWTSFWLLVTLS